MQKVISGIKGISWEKGKFPEGSGENYGGSNFAG
jgi:hypothetical protein